MGAPRHTQNEIWPALLVIGALLVLGLMALINPLLVVALLVAAGFIACTLKPDIGLYALMAILFFIPVTINAGWPGQTSTYVFFAALALAIGGRLARVLRGEQSISESAWVLWLLLPVALSGVVHGTNIGEWFTVARPLIVLVVVVWHVRAEARLSPERMRRVAVMIAWAAPALVLLAVYQRITGLWPVLDTFASSKSYTSRGDPSRTPAIMGHPIIYGSYCMVAAVISAALKPKQWEMLFAAAFMGLVLSGARSAWIGAAVALLVLLLIRRPKTNFRGLYSGLLVACAVVLAMILFPHAVAEVVASVSGRLENVAESSSALARNLRADLAWRQISDTDASWWWGLGPGSLVAYFTVTKVGDNLAAAFDNSYLSMWYEYGVIPVAIFSIVGLVAILRKGGSTGRLLMLALVAQIIFFDFYQWPLMTGAIALAVGLQHQQVPSMTVGLASFTDDAALASSGRNEPNTHAMGLGVAASSVAAQADP
jgi:hypothetical protein